MERWPKGKFVRVVGEPVNQVIKGFNDAAINLGGKIIANIDPSITQAALDNATKSAITGDLKHSAENYFESISVDGDISLKKLYETGQILYTHNEPMGLRANRYGVAIVMVQSARGYERGYVSIFAKS